MKKLTALAAGVALAVTLAPSAGACTIEEDSPKFNCYTMGNHDCGDSTVIKVRRNGRTFKVAVLAAFDDGRIYGSARSGRVVKLTKREAARTWLKCVRQSDYSDGELQSCDARYGAHDARAL